MLELLLTKILPCFLARLYLDQILPGTLEELGVNLGKILANQNLARQSWLFIQDTSKILGNTFSIVLRGEAMLFLPACYFFKRAISKIIALFRYRSFVLYTK